VFFLKPTCKNDGLPKNLTVLAYLEQAWRTWKGGRYADHLLICIILHVFLSYSWLQICVNLSAELVL